MAVQLVCSKKKKHIVEVKTASAHRHILENNIHSKSAQTGEVTESMTQDLRNTSYHCSIPED